MSRIFHILDSYITWRIFSAIAVMYLTYTAYAPGNPRGLWMLFDSTMLLLLIWFLAYNSVKPAKSVNVDELAHVLSEANEALDTARNGLHWYWDRNPDQVSENDHENDDLIVTTMGNVHEQIVKLNKFQQHRN